MTCHKPLLLRRIGQPHAIPVAQRKARIHGPGCAVKKPPFNLATFLRPVPLVFDPGPAFR
ncbi:hypothetical protein EMIT0P265_190026 [Pseudomonas zeae]